MRNTSNFFIYKLGFLSHGTRKVAAHNYIIIFVYRVGSKTLAKKSVKFGIPLAATSVNIFTENCTNVWSTSNTTGILFMHNDVT